MQLSSSISVLLTAGVAHAVVRHLNPAIPSTSCYCLIPTNDGVKDVSGLTSACCSQTNGITFADGVDRPGSFMRDSHACSYTEKQVPFTLSTYSVQNSFSACCTATVIEPVITGSMAVCFTTDQRPRMDDPTMCTPNGLPRDIFSEPRLPIHLDEDKKQGNKGQDKQGQGNKGQDKQGQDKQGQDKQGQDKQGQDKQGQDKQGQEKQGQEKQGQEKQGQEKQGQEKQGQEKQGQEKQGQKGQDDNDQQNNGQDDDNNSQVLN